MIQANELRLGLLFNVPREDQSPFRIDMIEHLSKNYAKVGMNQPMIGGFPTHPLTWYLEDLEPIPLTEEILLKCGFVACSFRENHFTIAGMCIWKCNDIFLCDKNGTLIKYLHQLQNLFFALNGQELDIK